MAGAGLARWVEPLVPQCPATCPHHTASWPSTRPGFGSITASLESGGTQGAEAGAGGIVLPAARYAAASDPGERLLTCGDQMPAQTTAWLKQEGLWDRRSDGKRRKGTVRPPGREVCPRSTADGGKNAMDFGQFETCVPAGEGDDPCCHAPIQSG
jgi:hypothetical protein